MTGRCPVGAGHDVLLPEEPVGNVDLGGTVFRGAFFLQDVGEGDGEEGLLGKGFLPGGVGVDVREDEDLSAFEHVQAVSELSFAAGSQPDELGAEGAADDGGLLGFNQADKGIGVPDKQMLSEETLADVPVFRQEALLLETGVDPIHRDADVFDAMAGDGVVLDDLAGADAALEVYLVEDGGAVPGDSQAVAVHEHPDGIVVKDAVEKGEEVTDGIQADGPLHEVFREEVRGRWNAVPFFAEPGRCLPPVFTLRTGLRMLLEVLGRGEMVAAGRLVVTAAYGLVYEVVGVIDIGRETVGPFALGTAESGGFPGVFCEVIAVLHTQSTL